MHQTCYNELESYYIDNSMDVVCPICRHLLVHRTPAMIVNIYIDDVLYGDDGLSMSERVRVARYLFTIAGVFWFAGLLYMSLTYRKV